MTGNPLADAVLRNPDYTIVDAAGQCLRCEKCGCEVPIPLGGIDWVSAYIKAFAKAHRPCATHPDKQRAFTSTITPVRSRPSRRAGSSPRRAD
jgi:hypothetical protein